MFKFHFFFFMVEFLSFHFYFKFVLFLNFL